MRCITSEDLGRACLDIIESITGSKLSIISWIGEDGAIHEIAASDPDWQIDETGHRQQSGKFKISSLYGRMLLDGRSLIINDLLLHPDSIGVPERHPQLTAFLGVPYLCGGKVAGLICLANREGGYRNEDQEIIEALTPTIFKCIMLKETEEKLHETRNYLDSLIGNANAPVIVWNPDFKITRFNHAFERLVGLSASEVIGEPLSMLFPENSRDESLNHIRQALAGEHWETVEIPILTSSGLIRTVLWNSANIYDAIESKIIATIAQGQDITDRKISEEALRNALAQAERESSQLEAIFAAQNDSILIYDTEMNVQRANRIFIQTYGFDPVGLNLMDIIRLVSCRWLDGRAFRLDEQPTPRALNGERVSGQRYAITRPDGVEMAVETSSGPIWSGDRIIGSVTVWRNITEQVKAEEALQLDQARAKILSDVTSQLLVNDVPKTIVENVCLKIMKFLDCQVFLNYLFDDDDSGHLHLNAYAGISNEKACEIERIKIGVGTCGCVFRDQVQVVLENIQDSKDSRADLMKSFGIEAYACLPLLYQGHALGTLSFGTSTRTEFSNYELALMKMLAEHVALATARIRDEEALVKARDELEKNVQTRTAELIKAKEELGCVNEELRMELEEHRIIEDELRKANVAAEAATRAKSDFMANMSHEIRTPMNAVIGMTSLLLDDETLNQEQRDFIETIRMSGDALMVIINDILDFSKLQEDKVSLENQPFDLRSCVEEALDLVAGKASVKGLNIAYAFNENVPETIIGDPNRLRQILSNLLSNAVKFTERGEIKVLVSTLKVDGNQELCFTVQDTGIGISSDQMAKLFKPFSQADTTSTRFYGGTGLGLVISKRLVELMEGEIWVESEPGKGSTFYFTIKAETALEDPKVRHLRNDPLLIGKHVLIISGSRTTRRILAGYIYSWGMVPMLASEVDDALNWIKRGDSFDVTILDIDIKQKNELEIANKISSYNRMIPLVMLISIGQHVPSGYAHLTKPIKPMQLQKSLVNIISAKTDKTLNHKEQIDKNKQQSSLKILLVEDNVTSQKVTKQLLKRLGYKADTAANGIEALQALERQHYDLVLMDVRMPEMDGLDATRLIRQRWPDSGPKIIAITAYALQGDMERCLDAGMDGYISKPIKLSELNQVLEKWS